MEKQDIIDQMHAKGYAEQVDEICEDGVVLYKVYWTRLCDGFQGPEVTAQSAQEAFTESALQTLIKANGKHR